MTPSDANKPFRLSRLFGEIQFQRVDQATKDPNARGSTGDGAIASSCLVLIPEHHRTDLSRARHDLKSAVRTLNSAITALRGGYTFQDESATAKIDAMARAHDALSHASDLLLRMFECLPPKI